MEHQERHYGRRIEWQARLEAAQRLEPMPESCPSLTVISTLLYGVIHLPMTRA